MEKGHKVLLPARLLLTDPVGYEAEDELVREVPSLGQELLEHLNAHLLDLVVLNYVLEILLDERLSGLCEIREMVLGRQFNDLETVIGSEHLLKIVDSIVLQFADGKVVRDVEDVVDVVLVQADLASVHVGEDKVEHLIILATLHLDNLLHRLVHFQLRIKPRGARGEDTPGKIHLKIDESKRRQALPK